MPAAVPIGRLQFDVDGLVLYDGTEIVPLAPLPARMLAELVRAGGEVVSSGAMREALWGDAPVEERNLNQQMYVLRRGLRRDPRVAIENVPRRGYRLVATPSAAAPAPARGPQARRGFSLAACLATALLAIVLPVHEARLDRPERGFTFGNFLLAAEGPHYLDRAASYYRDVVSRAPGDGAGYGGLALVDAKRALDLGEDLPARERVFETAQSEANAALARNEAESNALTAMGIIASVRDHCQATARRMFDAAVAADPSAETPRVWRAKYLLSIGDFEEAGQDLQAVKQIEPASGYAVGLFGEWLLLRRDYARATSVLAQAEDLGNHPGFTRYWLARSYYLRGLDARALKVTGELLALYPHEPGALALRLRIETRMGNERAALADYDRIARITDPSQIDPIALASADVALGRRSEALHAIRSYVTSGLHGIDEMGRLRTDPDFDSLRADPRFLAMLL